jgi:DsbC/DsbD-like thiol-disulfide interchange protein
MKRVLILLISIFLFPHALFATPLFNRSQAVLPQIKINVLTNKSVVFPGEKFKFFMSVLIEEGWHIYSLLPLKGSELLATQILMNENAFQEQKTWQEPEPVLILDEAVGKMVKGHKGNVEFSKIFNVPVDIEAGNYLIKGRLVYRACDNQICTLPQEVPFNTSLHIVRK